MSVLFPLITFPYAANVLGPEGLGSVQFAISTVAYFSVIAGFGISGYGIREVSKYRDHTKRLNILVREIFFINIIASAIAYFFLFIAIFNVNILYEHRKLIIICSSVILFTTIGMDWLFTGLEDFKYITIRSVVFQFFSLLFLFLFVRDSNDIINYAAISVFANVGSNICNFIRSQKILNIFSVKCNSLTRHIRPLSILFFLTLTYTVYTVMDVTMIQYYKGEYDVGLYAAATKVNRVLITLITCVGAVLLPRLSYYTENKQERDYNLLINKSLNIYLMFSMPAALILYYYAENIILLLCGNQFTGSVLAMQIMTPIILLVSISNIIGVQILFTKNMQSYVLISNVIGATVNFTLNFILIPKFGIVGAAFGTVFAESIITISQLYFARQFISFSTVISNTIHYLCPALLMIPPLLLTLEFVDNKIISIISGSLFASIIYLFILYLINDKIILSIIREILKK